MLSRFGVNAHRSAHGQSVHVGIALSVALAGGTALASQPANQPIIVEGKHLSQEAAREKAVQFVRATGVASGETPVARWVDPICPQVQGLEDRAKAAAEAKIRQIAAATGVTVAPESCSPNIVVNFTPDAPELARAIHRRDSWRLAQLSPRARELVLKSAAPIRWIYSTEVRGRHGESQNVAGGAAQTAPATHAGSGAGSSLGGDKSMMRYESSMVSTLTNRVLTSAIVIVDTDAVMGRRLDSLAAYAALVALAEIRNVEAVPDGSILSLFSSPTAPRDLTAQDAVFLRALYRIPLDRKARQHRGQLVQAITQSVGARD